MGVRVDLDPVEERQQRQHADAAPPEVPGEPHRQREEHVELRLDTERPHRAVEPEEGGGKEGVDQQQMGPELLPGRPWRRVRYQPCQPATGTIRNGSKMVRQSAA